MFILATMGFAAFAALMLGVVVLPLLMAARHDGRPHPAPAARRRHPVR